MIHARIRKRFAPGPDSVGFSLDIEFKAGAAVTVIFGPSGSGKTLTLDSIAGFVSPDEGRIMLDDEILFDGAARVNLPARERRCGYVFQNYALFPHMTLRQNMEFAVGARPRLVRHRRVNEMLERFHLGDVAGRRPHELSGGQKQRCSIARALIASPRALLLDEPARGLDPALRTELYAILREVKRDYKIPILLVTHDLGEAVELGDEMLVVREGRLAQSGPSREVIDEPANVDVARLLGLYNLFQVEIRALDPGRNSSRLRYQDHELIGRYIPGRLIGDRVWICVRPDQLKALPRNGSPSQNQIPAALNYVVEKPAGVRLEFAGDMAVEMARPDFEKYDRVKEWVLQFPPDSLRAL